jgi:putative redox protein
LFAHCFTCTKNSLAAVRIARALTKRGIGVLRFDFTGLGESGGDFADTTFSGNIQDLLAAAAQMAHAGHAPRLLIGHSLGGAATLAAALDLPEVAAVVTIGAPFDAHHVTGQLGDGLERILEKGEAEVELGGRSYTLRRSFLDDLELHDQAARIAHLNRPLLVLHSPKDEIVDIAQAAAIFQAAQHPKSFISLDDADHLLLRSQDDYAATLIAAWSSRFLPAVDAEMMESGMGATAQDSGVGRLQLKMSTGGARFLADEPVAAGGLGSGPTPYDLLCAALAACTAMTLRLYAAQKGWESPRLRVVVEHAKIKDRAPADVFSRRIAIEGDFDAAQRARLLEIAGRCPVHRTLEQGASVETTATV